VLAEVAARGSLSVADLLSTAMKLITYLIVLTIAVTLYLMVHPRESAPVRNSDAARYHIVHMT